MRLAFRYLIFAFLLGIVLLTASALSFGQSVDDPVYVRPNQEVKVSGLPEISAGEDGVLSASVAMAFMDGEICCGRKSALGDRVVSSTRMSLRQLGERLRGKQALPDGTTITVDDRFWAGSTVRAEDILAALMANRPLLMDWKGHLYVLYGSVFDLNKHQSGYEVRVVRKFLLIDAGESGADREVVFDRQKDSLTDVSGVLELVVKR